MILTKAERLLVVQIVNIKLDQATLKDHINLERIFKAARVEDINMPLPQDFVEEDQKELFQKYDNVKISEIKNKKHQEIISKAITKARQEETEQIWTNQEGVEILLDEEQIAIIKEFYSKDSRPFPRNFHQAIVDLADKMGVVGGSAEVVPEPVV